MLKGIALSCGVGAGKAYIVNQESIPVIRRKTAEISREKTRFYQAVDIFTREIELVSQRVRSRVSGDEANILSAQIEIIRDVELSRQVMNLLEKEHANVECVLSSVCDDYIRLFSGLQDETMCARAADLKDVKRRMLLILTRSPRQPDLAYLPTGSVLVTEELYPSRAAELNPRKTRGVATQQGAKFSHSAIIAQALGIPIVVCVNDLLDNVVQQDNIIVNSDTGEVRVNPIPGDLTYSAGRYKNTVSGGAGGSQWSQWRA